MTLTDGKGLLKSKTFWGGLVSLLPVIGKGLETAGIIPPGVFDASVSLITSTIGGILAIYGRFSATKQITSLL